MRGEDLGEVGVALGRAFLYHSLDVMTTHQFVFLWKTLFPLAPVSSFSASCSNFAQPFCNDVLTSLQVHVGKAGSCHMIVYMIDQVTDCQGSVINLSRYFRNH